jgi:hypothetical protein
MANSLNTTNPSRRAIVGGVAALAGISAAAIPVAAGTVAAADPVFAAIDQHNAARAILDATCPRTDSVVNPNITEDDQRAYDEADAAESAAFEALLDTRPETIAGLRAYLTHFDKVVLYFEPQARDLIAIILESPVLRI